MKTAIRKLAVAGLLASTLLVGGSNPLQKAPAKDAARPDPYEEGSPAERDHAARAGRKLFGRECASCHGEAGGGTRIAPALASPAVRRTTPGAIFWVLRNGSLRRGMPSFAHLPDQQRWQIVTYLKTL